MLQLAFEETLRACSPRHDAPYVHGTRPRRTPHHLPLGGGIRWHLAFIVTPPLYDAVVIAGNIDDASKELT